MHFTLSTNETYTHQLLERDDQLSTLILNTNQSNRLWNKEQRLKISEISPEYFTLQIVMSHSVIALNICDVLEWYDIIGRIKSLTEQVLPTPFLWQDLIWLCRRQICVCPAVLRQHNLLRKDKANFRHQNYVCVTRFFYNEIGFIIIRNLQTSLIINDIHYSQAFNVITFS